MSSIFGSDEDFEVAAAPKKAAPKKAAAAAPKKNAKKRAVSLSDDDGSDFGGNTPPQAKKAKKAPAKRAAAPKKPLADANDDFDDEFERTIPLDEIPDKPAGKEGDKYQKLSAHDHVLVRPDTYVGSIEKQEKHMWVFNSETNAMEWKQVSIVPGLYKCFDEVLVNAADNKVRDPSMDTIKVEISKENGTISVYNNGKGIPIEKHSKEKIWVPELIFGVLLTSSNYDDNEKKVTGGRNGYGAKLANIFSTEFIVETADKNTKQKYRQVWSDNMRKVNPPKITSNSKDEYTKVTFKPDLKRFGMESLDDDFEAIVKRRVYDMAGVVRGVKVFLNGERIKVKTFKDYIEMYVNAIQNESGEGASKQKIVYEKVNDRWEVGFAVSDGTFQNISFVNSIATTSGGTHVNTVADQLVARLAEKLKKKNKGGAAVKNNQIRNHFFVFVNAQIENPAFSSQTKEQLTTRPNAFGSKCVLGEKFLKDVENSGVLTNILEIAKVKADKQLAKSDGNRRSRISNPKLMDANKAGTREGYKCTLILTEGDSAKTLAVAGIGAIANGRDYYGVFPLRGKVLNVRDATVDQISKNVEIQNIKQILGLKHKTVYTEETAKSSLRYGHLMIMTDQDHDGSHIKGLLINFLETQYPSLLKLKGFLVEFITPIVRVFKGGRKNPTQVIDFYTMPEYEYWLEQNKGKGWEHKYYKGLATSEPKDAKTYFSNLDRHLKTFETMEDEGRELIELAFSKKKADERKEWLRQFTPGTYLDHSQETISYPDFVNKELILFSIADNMRSIPSAIDGFKPVQRKTMFTCFDKPFKKELKVLQLAAKVSEQTAYQHGEVSLQQTIVNMAQTFTGSNNINLLQPNGSFGTRLQGGKDAGSARYIYTQLPPITRKIFHPADDPLMNYNVDDGKKIDPDFYVPILPMVLVNGADGIGTGWSTMIPNYNPEDIVANIYRWMEGEELVHMIPWYRGWKGVAEDLGGGKYKFSGIINQIDDLRVEVTELPIKMWTEEFKEKLEEIMKAEKSPSFIKEYFDYGTIYNVHFVITMESEAHMKAALEEGLENRFKLTKTISTTNLVAFDQEGRIHRYETAEDILKEFCMVRLKFYQKRKDHILDQLNSEMKKLTNQARFLQMIIKKELAIGGRKKADIIADLKKFKFDEFSAKEAKKKGEKVTILEDDEEENEPESASEESGSADGYNYLLSMAIWNLTKEKVDKLLQQVADKEAEVDELLKHTPKDLWKKDLQDFLEQWRLELAEDEKRIQEEIKGKKSKGSRKLSLGPTMAKKKTKADFDDDDFEPTKKKAPAKAAAKPAAKPKANGDTDGDSKIAPIFAKARAAAKKSNVIVDLSDDEDKKPPPKAAPAKKVQKSMFDMSDDDLEEVTKPVQASPVSKKVVALLSEDEDDEPVVKAKPAEKKVAAKKSAFEPDFSDDDEVLPTKKAPAKKAAVKKSAFDSDDDSDEEEEKPAPKKKAAPAKKALLEPDFSDDDDDEVVPVKKAAAKKAAPKKAAAPKKEAPKAKSKPAAKKKAAVLSDDDISMAEDVNDDEDDLDMEEAPAPKPRAARAGRAKPVSYKLDTDDEEEDEDEESDGFGGDDSEDD